MSVFDKYYTQYYDLMYKDKNYKEETDYIISIIRRLLPSAKKILDLGCGTGKHAEYFANNGFEVLGVDRSPFMIEQAKKRKNEKLDFIVEDIRSLKLNKKFDVITALFHVLSYQNSNQDVKKFFEVAYNHLEQDGLFIFDFWYGPAVVTQKPEIRVKEFEINDVKFVRIAMPYQEYDKNLVKVHYKIFVIDKRNNSILEFEETHPMRYFFDPEIEMFLQISGFKVEAKFGWLKFDKPSENDWSVVWVVRKLRK